MQWRNTLSTVFNSEKPSQQRLVRERLIIDLEQGRLDRVEAGIQINTDRNAGAGSQFGEQLRKLFVETLLRWTVLYFTDFLLQDAQPLGM